MEKEYRENINVKYISMINTEKNKYSKKNNTKAFIYIFYIIIIIIFIIFIYFLIFKALPVNNQNKVNLSKIKSNILEGFQKIESLINNLNYDLINTNSYLNKNNFFDEKAKSDINFKLKYFCRNQELFYDPHLENNINLTKVKLDNITFDIFLYKEGDAVSNSILKSGNWEPLETKKILSSLNYYSKKEHISKNSIFMLDIGANIGWYSLYLGKNGYNVMSFEPSKRNYYILKKNFCLDENLNITIINKALDNEEKNCTLYHHIKNVGNAIMICDEETIDKSIYFSEEIELSALSKYIPYLVNHNLALIKIDVEGYEGKAIESGIDLIIKYHIPFILMEFTPRLLKSKGTDPKSLLLIFQNNGYKISKKDFLSNEYCSIDELLNIYQINIYFVYTKFLE